MEKMARGEDPTQVEYFYKADKLVKVIETPGGKIDFKYHSNGKIKSIKREDEDAVLFDTDGIEKTEKETYNF